MNPKSFLLLVLLAGMLAGASHAPAAPVWRSTLYQGVGEETMNFDYEPWMNATVAMTVEAWVYREDAGRCETIISHNYYDSFWFGFCPRLRFYRSGNQYADADVDVPAGQWTHVAASYTGSRVQFYINGELAGDKALANSGPGPDNELNIGGSPEGLSASIPFGFYYQGYLDEIRLWSVARTQPEIQGGLHEELRTGTGLVAAFSAGSYREEIHEVYSNDGVTFERLAGFGVLPRNLRIPRTTANITLDGVADLTTEYAGAEQMVVRYDDGTTIRDAVAHLVYRNESFNVNDRHLYVAISGLKPPENGRPWSDSYFHIQIDPDNSGGTGFGINDFYISADLNGQVGAYQKTGTVLFSPISASTQTWQASVNFCEGEFLPACVEVRIHENMLGDFDNVIGLAIGQLGVVENGDTFMAPSDAISFSARTYPDAVFGGNANTGLKTIAVTCLVSNTLAGVGAEGHSVRMYSGVSSLTGLLIGQGTTDSDGRVYITGQALEEEPVTVSLQTKLDHTYFPPIFGNLVPVSGRGPIQTNHNWEVVYQPCTNNIGPCNLVTTLFPFHPPPPPLALNSFDPTNGAPPVVLRTSPLKTLSGTTVRLHGSNLHDRVNVFLTQCNQVPTSLCSNAPNHYAVEVIGRSPRLDWIDVEIPEIPPSGWSGGYRWLIEDLWIRPGYRQWNYAAPAAGLFVLGEHSYPLIHGFEFANTDDDGGLEVYEGTYGESVFSYLPFPPFKIRDPHYYGVWFPIYLILMEASNGSCYGMASTSRLFANGTYDVDTYDLAPGGGDDGVRFAAGFRGRMTCDPGDFVPCAPKPGTYSGFDAFNAYRPLNLWAQINVNMGVQFSSEAIVEVLGQGRDGEGVATIGDPIGVMGRIESRRRGYVLCIKPADGATGHCVTPLRVEHGFKLNADALAPVPDPDFSLIHIYDNNHPNQTRYIEINRTANLYRYRLGVKMDGTVKIWESSRIYTYRMELFTSRRHAPGFDVVDALETLMMMIVGGDADGLYVDRNNKKAGWDFHNVYHQDMPGAGILIPYANPLEDREARTGIFLAARTNLPANVYINNKGPYYVAHAGIPNMAIQLERMDAQNGYQDVFTPSIGKDGQLSVRYIPEWPANLITPKISMSFQTNSRAIFRWEELSVPGTEGIYFEADPIRRGASLYNDASVPLTYRMKIDAVNDYQPPVLDGDFGEFTVVPGGTQNFLWHDWPHLTTLRVETDDDSDGVPERIDLVESPFVVLNITLTETEVILTWESPNEGEFIVQYASEASRIAHWTAVTTPPEKNGTNRKLVLPRQQFGSSTFFRLNLPSPGQ